MTTTKSDTCVSEVPKSQPLYGLAKFLCVFALSIYITAKGQPDRAVWISTLSYIFGYSSIFVLLIQFEWKTARFFLALFWMFLVQLQQLDWLATTKYHGNGILLVYLLLSAGIALQFALLSFMLPKSKSFTFVRCAAMASIWTIFEISRLYYLCGFPFNSTGLVMSFHPMILQMAALFGVYGLSFWVIFSSTIAAKAFKQKSIYLSVLWISLLLLPVVFGFFHMRYHTLAGGKQSYLDVALVQTGLSVEQKWEFPFEEEKFIQPFDQWKSIFNHLNVIGKKQYDLIVLPEVALPGNAILPDLEYDRVVEEILEENDRLPPLMTPYAKVNSKGKWLVSHVWMAQAIANRFKSELITGLIDHDDKSDESYNAAFHFIPFRTNIQRYEKRVLVPLAEYLPLPMMKSFLEKFGISTFFTPGKRAKLFNGQLPLAVSICYEEGYSNLIREARMLGAALLVNVTNDGWFPRSRLPQEHFNLGRLRAIENGVPVLRACNTGITAMVDSLGRVQGEMKDVDRSGKPLSGVLASSIGTYSYSTLFALFGNNLILFVSAVIILGFFFYKKTLRL